MADPVDVALSAFRASVAAIVADQDLPNRRERIMAAASALCDALSLPAVAKSRRRRPGGGAGFAVKELQRQTRQLQQAHRDLQLARDPGLAALEKRRSELVARLEEACTPSRRAELAHQVNDCALQIGRRLRARQ